MNNTNIWAVLLRFGANIHGKPGSGGRHNKMVCDMEIWNKVTEYLPGCGVNTVLIDIGDGVKLESHPDMAIEGAVEKAEFREMLARLRELGLNPLPKCNFSGAHNGWMNYHCYTVGSKKYYQFCRDVIEEFIDLFDTPELFHLGLEEENFGDQYSKGGGIVTVRNQDQFIKDAHDLFDTCKKKGVRPWMWMDPDLLEILGGEENFRNNVPKDILLSNWYYGYVSPAFKNSTAMCSHSGRIETYNLLDKWGYEQVPTCSSYLDKANQEQTMAYCKATFEHPENLRGFLTAPWGDTTKSRYYKFLFEAWNFGVAKRKNFPECK